MISSGQIPLFSMEPDSSADNTANATPDDLDRTSRYLRETSQQLNTLSAEMQRIAAKQDELAEEHDRIDNLEHCNRHATSVESAVNTALQRIRITEEAIRNIQLIKSETRFQILEATCEHLTIRANRLATRVADFERLLSVYRIS